jgi:hypothetical protein
MSDATLQVLRQARSKVIASCYEYWAQCRTRSGRPLPGRQHIDPIEMAPFLRHVVLFDVLREAGRHRFRHRLVGTEFAEIFGRDVTGQNLEDAGSVERMEAVHKRFSLMVDAQVLVYGVSPSPVTERNFIQYEHLTLPLAADGETVDMLFGVRCILPTLEPAEYGYATALLSAA